MLQASMKSVLFQGTYSDSSCQTPVLLLSLPITGGYESVEGCNKISGTSYYAKQKVASSFSSFSKNDLMVSGYPFVQGYYGRGTSCTNFLMTGTASGQTGVCIPTQSLGYVYIACSGSSVSLKGGCDSACSSCVFTESTGTSVSCGSMTLSVPGYEQYNMAITYTSSSCDGTLPSKNYAVEHNDGHVHDGEEARHNQQHKLEVA
eukprot:g81814.t1